MLVAEAVNTETPVLQMNDSLEKAVQQMDALQVNSLPVINQTTQKLAGQLRRESIAGYSAAEKLKTFIADIDVDDPIVIGTSQHLFYAVQLMLQHELRMLPVVDEDHTFQGVIQKQQVLALLGRMLNLTEFGSIITVELAENDFTISEIVQLIETEGGKILGVTVEAPNSENQFYEVSFKLNINDVSRVAASLRRFGYSILTEEKSDSNNIDLETRADEFLKYLDI